MTTTAFEEFEVCGPGVFPQFPDGIRRSAPMMALDSYMASLRTQRVNPVLATEHNVRTCQRMIHSACEATERFIGRKLTQPEGHEAWVLCSRVTLADVS